MMRYDPVVHGQAGYTTREIKIHGEVIPERAVHHRCFLGAGNRDERVFKDPDTFDIFRDDLHMGRELRSGRYPDGKHGHLGFGMGQHFCMGYAMARQEAIIACTRLAEAMKNPRPKFPTHPGITSPVTGVRWLPGAGGALDPVRRRTRAEAEGSRWRSIWRSSPARPRAAPTPRPCSSSTAPVTPPGAGTSTSSPTSLPSAASTPMP